MEGNNKRPRDEYNSEDLPELTKSCLLDRAIKRAKIDKMIRNFCLSLEPIIQNVVQNSLVGTEPLYGNDQYYIENLPPMPHDPKLKFVFVNQVSKVIYTGNIVTDDLYKPLQIQLVDIGTGKICENGEGSSEKVKIVAIDADLKEEDFDSDKFNNKIVPAREGKKVPLLVGNTLIKLNKGIGNLEGIFFTDKSKWVRSGKFRLGVCVDSETSSANEIKIKEGLSSEFVVKYYPYEFGKKHYPPMLCLEDEIWRLETISKDGKYHKRLKKNGIKNVQDFLRRWFLDENDLRENILKMPKDSLEWYELKTHAIKCPNNEDSYLFRSEGKVIRFGSTGKILEVFIDGISYSYIKLTREQMVNVNQLASQARQQWDQLEKVSIHFPLNELWNAGYGNGGNLETDMLPSSTGTNSLT